jgi:hypothetical protein
MLRWTCTVGTKVVEISANTGYSAQCIAAIKLGISVHNQHTITAKLKG